MSHEEAPVRLEVEDLARLGPFPYELDISDADLTVREDLVRRITEPVSEEEARAMLRLFGEDELFGLAWSLVTLIESAPGWPYWDELSDATNEWHDRLRRRATNAQRSHGNEGERDSRK
jgi:hypothetical protein